MTKYCKNCGSELSEGSVFCDECGTRTAGHSPVNNNLFGSYNIDMMNGEYVIRQSQVHIGCLIPPLIVFCFGIILAVLNVITISSYSYGYYNPFGLFVLGFFNFFTIFGLIWIIIRFIAYKTNDLILTNKRVFGKCGLISTTQMQAPLNKFDSVSFSNGPIGKLIGYGTVKIATTSSVFKFRFIRDGQTWYNDIFNQLENSEVEKRNENAKAIVDAMAEKLE
jgi:membrane protein YdbS with pleckstrin-like domain